MINSYTLSSGLMYAVLLACATAIASALLTGAVRRYSLERAVLDVPNERSSHTTPTPRGGGFAIVATLLAAIFLACVFDWVPYRFTAALLPGGILIAGVGWIDDHRPLSARQRLIAHFTAAGWATWILGGLPALQFGTQVLPLGAFGSLFAVLTITWLTNLYNFMDGIDGIAATEAVTVGIGAATVAMLSGAHAVANIALLMAAAASGFLIWNWQPARIFMGDVGSGFLGYALAVTALFSEVSSGPSLLMWGLLLGVFVLDATLTLLRRAIRGERVSAAHRKHAYQRAVRSGMSHAQVCVSISLLNLILFAMVAFAHFGPHHGFGVAVLGSALLLLAVYLLVERRLPMFSATELEQQVH